MRQRDEVNLLRGRIRFLSYIIVGIFAVLLLGFWNHQMVHSSYYAERAEQNRVREIPLIAQRGRIYDRFNRLLADNRPSYNIVLTRENSPHTVEQTAAMLAGGIEISIEEILERVEKRKRQPKFRPIVLKEDVSVADIAFVRAHKYELPEISIEEQPRRRYLGGDLAAHALGYVGEVNEVELGMREFVDFKAGDQVGKAGLERQYNRVLRGRDGFKRVVVNIYGREMGQLEAELPIPGNDLHTTLDLDLQRAAEEAIGEFSGAAVALDPNTGEILAFVSRPAYDPNLFATRISSTDWNKLITDPRKPLQNRVIQSHFSPGSVFKIFTAAAGLEAQTLSPLHTLFCPGHATHYGHTFRCDKPTGHGNIGLHHAIVSSCNVYFYDVGKELGIERIAKYTTMMGFGRKTGIDLPNEETGIIPSTAWKQRVLKTNWYLGETISVSIGQGYVTTTPIQAAWAMGGLTTGGRLKQPHLVSPGNLRKIGFSAGPIRTEEYPVHASTVDIVTRAMWGVVHEEGTGTLAKVEGFDVAGKTGTAQVVGMRAGLKGERYKDNAWFVGFAPYRNPEIVVAAFVENGGWGGVAAAPVARAVLDTYYRKKTGTFNKEKTPNMAHSGHSTASPGGR